MRTALSTGPDEGRELVESYKQMAAKVLADA